MKRKYKLRILEGAIISIMLLFSYILLTITKDIEVGGSAQVILNQYPVFLIGILVFSVYRTHIFTNEFIENKNDQT